MPTKRDLHNMTIAWNQSDEFLLGRFQSLRLRVHTTLLTRQMNLWFSCVTGHSIKYTNIKPKIVG
jgi:hypothetical protein